MDLVSLGKLYSATRHRVQMVILKFIIIQQWRVLTNVFLMTRLILATYGRLFHSDGLTLCTLNMDSSF